MAVDWLLFVGLGLAAQATIYRNSGGLVSGIPKFNASVPLLPGMELPREFEF